MQLQPSLFVYTVCINFHYMLVSLDHATKHIQTILNFSYIIFINYLQNSIIICKLIKDFTPIKHDE